ncbi:MAG: hypothetical protein LKF98_05515, partial [Microbacteriaceae bacterium]|nr:hypothetical protein [Microbacteriaceae bacterium]
ECLDAYGVVSPDISTVETGPISDSNIIKHISFPDSLQEKPLIAELVRYGKAHPGPQLILMANTDWHIRVIAEHRAELEPYYLLPYPPLDVIDTISDKAEFARTAQRLGIPVPLTIVQSFADADLPTWQPVGLPQDLNYPVIAKAAASSDYEHLKFPGKKKVYEIKSQEELDGLWSTLRKIGFRGRFVVQELIPGDDTEMYSITAYIDRNGKATLLSSAHVLLEEHHPAALGNPCAMITGRIDEILEPAKRFLSSMPYRGFANFDVKRDPRTGKFTFFEINPRIGRNNFYVSAAGVNPMSVMVADQLGHESLDPQIADTEILYSVVPHRLLLRYVLDPHLRAHVIQLQRGGRRVHPLKYFAVDHRLKRRLYIALAMLNQYRKFNRYYPKPTGTGF